MAIETRSLHYVAVVALLVAAVPVLGSAAELPQITSQGFDIDESQPGELGQFQRLRVRFEVPGRIDELRVRERSYEVDLATTPEIDHLPLFGLDRQVRQMTDVTLDFQRYINTKIDRVGSYEFELTVADRHGERASARLVVEVTDQPVDDLRAGSFRAVREGTGNVAGAERLGFRWTTIESDGVIIQLAANAPDGYFFDIATEDYAALRTHSDLRAAASSGDRQETLELAAAANRSAGSVFGVAGGDAPLLLKVTRSHTSLSDIGTTVTLEGEFKF